MSLHVEIDRKKIAAFCRKWTVTELSIFGSALRDDFNSESDVDVLVTFAPGEDWDIKDLDAMQLELKEILGRDVDLVERQCVENSENYIRRKHILSHLEKVYVAG